MTTLTWEARRATAVLSSPETPMVPVATVHGARVVTTQLKLEGYNRFGSIKARTARGLVEALEEEGRLRPGVRIVESTSGNLGVALAGLAAERGYRFTAVVDPRTAPALLDGMAALGADLDLVTEDDGAGGYLISRLRRVRELTEGRTDRVWTNQYGNQVNPAVHERITAPELDRQAPDMDAVFVAVSTGGTLAGIGRYLREHRPRCRVIGVDVPGSMAFGGQPGRRRVLTGIGASVRSQFLEPWMYDEHVEVEPADALAACRRLAAHTGIELGGSGGAVLAACLRYLQADPEIRNPVCLCPDSGASYQQTIFDDDWLRATGLESVLQPWPGGPLFLRGEI